MTSLYKLGFKRSAEKELRAIPKIDLQRLLHKIESLPMNPRPHGSQKLSTQELYRIRQGDWRIVYFIDDKEKHIEVIKIGHRREVYR